MKTGKIFIVTKSPQSPPEIKLHESDIRNLSTLIQGKREIIPFPNLSGVCIMIESDWEPNASAPNCSLPEYNDILLGTIVVAAVNIDTGFVSLDEDATEQVFKYLQENSVIEPIENVKEKISTNYLSLSTDENYIYSMLSEVKSKYKSISLKWMQTKNTRGGK